MGMICDALRNQPYTFPSNVSGACQYGALTPESGCPGEGGG
jgi:hypothetical protein